MSASTYTIPVAEPRKIAKAAVKSNGRSSALCYYGKKLDVRARPQMKYDPATKGEKVDPERLKLEFFVKGENGEEDRVFQNERVDLPFSVMFGAFSAGGNHSDTYNAEQAGHPWATIDTVATAKFGSSHKHLYTFEPLPITKSFYDEQYPDGKHGQWGMQHNEFWTWLQGRVNEIIVDLVKKRSKLGPEKDPIKIKYPEMIMNFVPTAADPLGSLLKLDKVYYKTVKPANKNEPDSVNVKVPHKAYATGTDYSKGKNACKNLILPAELECLRGDYEREGCVPVSQNITALVESDKRKRADDSDDEFDDALRADKSPAKKEIVSVSLNPAAQSFSSPEAGKKELTKRSETLRADMLKSTFVVKPSYKETPSKGFTILFTDNMVKMYPPKLDYFIVARLPYHGSDDAMTQDDDDLAAAMHDDSDSE